MGIFKNRESTPQTANDKLPSTTTTPTGSSAKLDYDAPATAKEIAALKEESNPTAVVPEVILKPGEELFHADHHPIYVVYFKQIIKGVPRATVEAAMKQKNLNLSILDTPKAMVIYRPKKKPTVS
jgi:hypothetical protein